jgi:hypothetical protein
MKNDINEVYDRLERIEELRKRSKGEFDKLSKKEQEEELLLDEYASILLGAYLDLTPEQKKELVLLRHHRPRP